ncbi:MAG TPA: methyltransferase [Thermodesulfobacteriota bacterium]|nr:methyltransferase [Thermodesulfobacteriota bacterium]
MDTEKTNTLTLFILEGADAYHQWVFDKIRPYLGKDILEVGCGIGNLTGLLLNQARVIVTDVNRSYLQRVENKYRDHPNLKGILVWDVEESLTKFFDIPIDIPIDTILCSNVLEHINMDEAALENFFRLLPQGGRLIVLVPALKMLYNALDKELGHFRRYNRAELAQKLVRNGFRICSSKYFNFFGIIGWFVNGTLLKRRLLQPGQIKTFNAMVPLFVWMEKVVPTLVGQSLIVVGEKG